MNLYTTAIRWFPALCLLGMLGPAHADSGTKAGVSPSVSKRIGACIGIDESCSLLGANFEFTTQHVGISVSPFLPTASLKVYLIPGVFYFHGGAGVALGGGGVGWDIHMLKSRKLILQPQIGTYRPFIEIEDIERFPGISLSLMYALGTEPNWRQRTARNDDG